MARFIVTRREVWTQGVSIEARSEAEALRLVNDGGGETEEDLFEYSHTLDGHSTVESWPEADTLGCMACEIAQKQRKARGIRETPSIDECPIHGIE